MKSVQLYYKFLLFPLIFLWEIGRRLLSNPKKIWLVPLFLFLPLYVQAGAVDDSYSTTVNTDVSSNVLNNDTGNSRYVKSNTDPSNGSVSVNRSGDFTYTPNTDFTGTDTFTYTMKYRSGFSWHTDTATVTITVSDDNDSDSDVDLCYDSIDYSGMFCMNFGAFQGGFMCKQTINLRNISDSTLTDVQTVIDMSGFSGSFLSDCGIDDTSGNCQDNNAIDFGPVGIFNRGILYSPMPDFDPDDTHSIYNQSLISMSIFSGQNLYARYTKDGTSYTVNLDKCPIDTSFNGAERDFILRNPDYSRNIPGDVTTIGNTNECVTTSRSRFDQPCTTDRSKTANDYMTKYNDIDNNSSTFNSSSATLALDNNRTVVWAALYWQGFLHSCNESTNDDCRFRDGDSVVVRDDALNLASNSYDAPKILFQTPNHDYHTVQANVFDYIYNDGARGTIYSAYADVTDLIDFTNPNGVYTAANIQSMEGLHGFGNYAAWMLVVIYRGEGEEYRNVSVYDGFKVLESGDNVNIHVKDFRTPESGKIDSTLLSFAGEGEYRYGPDYIELEGNKLSDTGANSNKNNVFNSSISGFEHNPDLANANGIDIDIYDVSEYMQHNQTEADITIASRGDYFYESVIGFSTQLYVPDICYDYAVVTTEGMTFTDSPDWDPDKQRFGHHIEGMNSSGNKLLAKVFIRSMEGDLQLQNVFLGITDLDTEKLTFDKGEISPDGTFGYKDVTPLMTSPDAFIPFGNDADPDHDGQKGGTIDANQRFYANVYFDYTGVGGDLDEYMNIEVLTQLDFGSGPISYRHSTKLGNLPRCGINPVYDPIRGRFNIERKDANHESSSELEKYPLHTQISGKAFEVSVVSYDADDSNTLLKLDDVGVEVELFNAGSFENNSSTGFDSVCNDYTTDKIIQRHFVAYPKNTPTAVVDVAAFSSDIALRNAAFRIWFISDENGTLVFSRDCYAGTYPNDSCFANEYHANGNEIKSIIDPGGICESACSTSNGCYECLKTNFGYPVCSYDNFAIRPAAFHVKLFDDGQSDDKTKRQDIVENNDTAHNTNTFNLAAEYDYPILIEAVDYNGSNPVSKYFSYFAKEADESHNIQKAILAFKNDAAKCADSSDIGLSDQSFFLSNGKNDDLNLSAQNAGRYRLSMLDTTWTIVDQQDYPYITRFDGETHADCLEHGNDDNKTNEEKYGCYISSDVPSASVRPTFTGLDLNFMPYHFDLSGIRLDTVPTNGNPWIYMNNLNNDTTMAVTLEGNITAIGAKGNRLTNYTIGCAVTDSMHNMLWLDRNMSMKEDQIVSEEKGNHVAFQQWLKADQGTPQPVQDTKNGPEMNATLTAQNFTSDRNGSAETLLYYNFEKPYTDVVNPVIVTFETLNTAAPSASSYADMKSDYIPDGNVSIDQNITYLFAKVSESVGTDESKIYTPDISITTKIRVDVYCKDSIIPDINCSRIPDLTQTPATAASSEEAYLGGGWYRMLTHGTDDGEVLSLTADNSDVAIDPSTYISLENGISADIEIRYPLSANRPAHPVFSITPNEWLRFNTDPALNGIPTFTLHFLTQGLKWKGTGKTGNVIQTQPTINQNKRLNW
jgi:hypothetical protein